MKKNEAVKRMKILGMHKNVINEFVNEDKLNYSENGVLFWIKEDWKEYVKTFEEKHDCLVYHLIYNKTRLGDLITMLYVSNCEEEWQDDINLLQENIAYAYVKNLKYDYYSEIGQVQLKPFAGGVLRVA